LKVELLWSPEGKYRDPILAVNDTESGYRASGLGRACVDDICGGGGYAAILDLNEELASAAVKQWGDKAKFFECNVLKTESVTAAVEGAAAWAKETGKQLGGVIAAAGVANPGKVTCLNFSSAKRGLTAV
jgi:3-hydroxyacyl-CoA dehydrogenase/3-hydroxy-2-methylbutyryl-CoA dehydrogenase